jgi:hypothetical protein
MSKGLDMSARALMAAPHKRAATTAARQANMAVAAVTAAIAQAAAMW